MFDESEMAPIDLSSIMVNTAIFYSKKETIDLSEIQNIKLKTFLQKSIKLKRELRNLDSYFSRNEVQQEIIQDFPDYTQ